MDMMRVVEIITVMIRQWHRLHRKAPQLVFVLEGFQAPDRENPEKFDVSSELTM